MDKREMMSSGIQQITQSELLTHLSGRIFARFVVGIDRADMWFATNKGFYSDLGINMQYVDFTRFSRMIWDEHPCFRQLPIHSDGGEMLLKIINSLEEPYRQLAASVAIIDVLRINPSTSYAFISPLAAAMLDGWSGKNADLVVILSTALIRAIYLLCFYSDLRVFRKNAAEYAQESRKTDSRISREDLAMQLAERWLCPILQNDQDLAKTVMSFLKSADYHGHIALFGTAMLVNFGMASSHELDWGIIEYPNYAILRKLRPFIARADKRFKGHYNLRQVIEWVLKEHGRESAEQTIINALMASPENPGLLLPIIPRFGMQSAKRFSEWIELWHESNERGINHALRAYMHAYNAAICLHLDWSNGYTKNDKACNAWFKGVEAPLSSLQWSAPQIDRLMVHLENMPVNWLFEKLAHNMLTISYLARTLHEEFNPIRSAIEKGAQASEAISLAVNAAQSCALAQVSSSNEQPYTPMCLL